MSNHHIASTKRTARVGTDRHDDYLSFLESKIALAPPAGFEVDLAEINPALRPHCKPIVQWAIRGGRRAIFASFGLHKTSIQLEIMRLIGTRVGTKEDCGRRLIVLPLGVRQEFFRDAAAHFQGKYAVKLRFIRSNAEVDLAWDDHIYLTNYESVRDGKLDPALFDASSLDEASVLRSYGTKTYHEFLRLFDKVRFKFVATATPSPNRYKELIHYAGFLGVMDTGLALTRFFQRDATSAGNLTLYPHKQDEFWLWMHSWALFVQRPSDLGFSDDGYDLPELDVVYHEVPTNHGDAGWEKDGQGLLLRDAALGVTQAAREKRDSLPTRVARMQEIIAADPDAHMLLWHDLEDERRAIEDALPTVEYGAWREFKDGHPAALALYERHYSAHQYADGRERKLLAGPGEKTVMLTAAADALFVWRKFIDDSGQKGINCAVFRNERGAGSIDLILEAMAIGWLRWPGQRFYTYVDAAAIRSTNPGYCFLQAGWRKCGKTKGGLVILEALPGCQVPAITPKPCRRSVFGSQDLETREGNVIAFSNGEVKYLATKPELSGSGCNFQRYCHTAVFLGIGFKFNDFIQAIHRIQRFGQTKRCRIHLIHTEAEREVLRTLLAKWERHKEMMAIMGEIIRKYGLDQVQMADVLKRSIGVQRIEIAGERYKIANNDCVLEARLQPANSVDQIITSIPFSNHYEYTDKYEDFGHTDDNAHFWQQMDFLTPELLRILKPGRLACIHVKDRIVFGAVAGTGAPTVSPFHAETLFHFMRHGFDFMGMHTIVTDVVAENNQTYRLGYSENAKDSTRMGCGSPEYVLLMRKPQTDRSSGYADCRVTKDKGAYSLARWQVDAHAFWRSSGNRLPTADELAAMGPGNLAKAFPVLTLAGTYNYEFHVRIGEELEARGALPTSFMSLAPGSHDPNVWHDINRLLTLNSKQVARNVEKHICPLQFDIVDRLIDRFSNPDELIYDPFGGLMTVPYRAILKGRRGQASELSHQSFLDGAYYCRDAEGQRQMPSLFDILDANAAPAHLQPAPLMIAAPADAEAAA